jgi:hypothetical protein
MTPPSSSDEVDVSSLWTPPSADLGDLAGPEPDPRMVNFRRRSCTPLCPGHRAPHPACSHSRAKDQHLPNCSNPRHNARTPQAGAAPQDRRHSHSLGAALLRSMRLLALGREVPTGAAKSQEVARCCCWSPSTLTGQLMASSASLIRRPPTCLPRWPYPSGDRVRPARNDSHPSALPHGG